MSNWRENLKMDKCCRVGFGGSNWPYFTGPDEITVPLECIRAMKIGNIHENYEMISQDGEMKVYEYMSSDVLVVYFNEKVKECKAKEKKPNYEFHDPLMAEYMQKVNELLDDDDFDMIADEWFTANTAINRIFFVYEDGSVSPDIYLPIDTKEGEDDEWRNHCQEYAKNDDEKESKIESHYSELTIFER